MRKFFSLAFALFAGIIFFTACNHVETYAEKKAKEKAAIEAYIANNKIEVISEKKFKDQNCTTDVSKNEFVLFEGNGVYLQIVRKGCGKPISDGETCDILCRFTEYNLITDSLQLSNDVSYFSSIPEVMVVKNTSGTYTGSFDSSSSLMYTSYGSASVPSGWLVPLAYINIGRPVEENDEVAKIKIIVPGAQGQAYASQYVYPCMYELTYQKGK